MELQQFIHIALRDIIAAVETLQREQGARDIAPAVIVPPAVYERTPDVATIDGIERRIALVNFDIAVTAEESSGTGAGAKVGITVFNARIDGESSAVDRRENRISFVIPVALPFVRK